MDTNENINIGDAIELYVTARDKKAEMEARHTAELEPVLEALEEAKALVIGYMVTNKQDGIRTEHGMASLGITDKVYVQDRAAFVSWVKETGNVELLETRVVKSNALAYLEEHGAMPPGIDHSKSYALRVTARKGK